LERELENERALSQLGERVGRVAHGLKNAVHSLRGFVGLIEPKLQGRRSDQAALAGLRSAIDRLETLARLTLDAKETGETGETTDLHASDCAPARCLERAVREISLSHPGVHWATASDGTNPALPISAADLLEVLLILLRNGAEATNGGGKGSIQMHSAGSEFHVVVCDGGAGFSPEATSRIFEPGYTTKPEGSGYGLFLARRILEKHGGHLEAKRTGGGGATFELALPVTPGERASPAIARSR
jgi:signal transduction histidine kinase